MSRPWAPVYWDPGLSAIICRLLKTDASQQAIKIQDKGQCYMPFAQN